MIKFFSLFLTILFQVAALYYSLKFGEGGSGAAKVLIAIIFCLIVGLFFYSTRAKTSLPYQISWGITSGSLFTIIASVAFALWVTKGYWG